MASKPRSAHLHPGPGFRVRMNFPRLSAELMREFANFATPDISDMLNRLYAVSPAVRCLSGEGRRLCGPACTVKVFPGDNLMVHKALDVLEPGDVVVVDAGGSAQNAVLGDLISMKARHRGAAGFVVDGYVRDLPNIRELDLPVFARGTTPIGPLHRGPGEINCPICCGGVVVNAGDLIVGDAMGVVVVPQVIAAELLERLRTHEAASATYLESVRRGVFSNDWVDQILTTLECPIIRGPGPAHAAVAAAGAAPIAAACGPAPAEAAAPAVPAAPAALADAPPKVAAELSAAAELSVETDRPDGPHHAVAPQLLAAEEVPAALHNRMDA